MPVISDGTITIQICSGSGPATVSVAMPGMAMADHGPGHEETPSPHEKVETPCAFAGLAAPTTGAIDPVVLAVAIASVLAAALRRPDRRPTAAPSHLRPPSRAPPAII